MFVAPGHSAQVMCAVAQSDAALITADAAGELIRFGALVLYCRVSEGLPAHAVLFSLLILHFAAPLFAAVAVAAAAAAVHSLNASLT